MNKLELKQICLWPLTAKIITLAVLFFLLCSLGYMLDVKPLKDQLTNVTQQNLLLQQKLQQQRHVANDYTDKPANFEEIQAIYKQKLQQQIIMPILINHIANIANNNHINLKSLQPNENKIEDWLILHPIAITANGDYHQLTSFIKQLMDLSYFIVVQNFRLTREKDNHKNLTLQALIIVYSKNKQEK